MFFSKGLSSLKVQNETKKDEIINGENKQRKVRKNNYNSLKKKIKLKNESISNTNKSSLHDEKTGISSINELKKMVVADEEYINSEYKKCIDVVEKELNDKKNNDDIEKIKEEMEKLCLLKKKQDEKEEIKKKNEEEIKIMKAEIEKKSSIFTDKEKKEKEIISSLGLSNKIPTLSETLNDLLSEVKNCERDYTEKCPMNWQLNKNDNKYCNAPDSYVGPCEKQIKNEMDISEKIQTEKNCFIFWPCNKNCIQNFKKSKCPIDWILTEDNFCMAPQNYTGNCLKKINFIKMNEKEKAIYSNLCNIRWSCKEACKRDYSVLCPEGWIEGSKGYCLATNTYDGICEKRIYLKDSDKTLKQMYEQKCQFNYPCINSCQKKYDDLCPNLWFLINNNECAPSESYTGNCKENYIFKNKTIEEKKMFEEMCDISYPCLQTCKRDYSYNCPIGWKETLSYCLAPVSYKHNCKKIMRTNMTEKEKLEISTNCHVFWPCSNYEILLKKLIYNNLTEEDYMYIVNGPVDNATGSIFHV
ncbi:CPW-WPC family protein [Hepatocystis sp. ex Piliocolobus tephrosceles]|nr:CPW-WPC family protein [Hepatocystis sp. ex Piliocolobus tephrosceles]